jgi:exodeoxyribonuclease VII large subunit
MDNLRILSVRDLTLYIKGLLDKDRLLQNVWVRGELSNFKLHSPSGHMYFTLKDEQACIRGVMFRSKAILLPFRPLSGMKVILRGTISLYERDGQYQLYAEEMQPDGLGAIHLALEQLKEKLAAEGLFDPERKRPLPKLPRAVGVATSTTGAAVQDILKVMFRRFPNIQVVIAPCAVQGEAAPVEIAKAISRLNSHPGVDLIIAGRGGGSREELWAFNSEVVVRAIAESSVPVISAVGHETDITLADLAADLRAPTPSAAAELAVPAKLELITAIHGLENRLNNAIQTQIKNKRRVCELLSASPALKNPLFRVNQEKQYLDQLRGKLLQSSSSLLKDNKSTLNILIEKLDSLSPLKVLARGYSVCQKPSGELLTDSRQVELGEDILVTLSKGKLQCIVKEVEPCQVS